MMEEITFSEDNGRDVRWPHNDALAIHAHVDNIEIRRIMVDTGSLENVMYKTCFDQMGLGAE